MTGSRAMTLVELLVSLALFVGLVVTANAWIQIAGASGARLAEPLRWERGAAAVLALVQGDIEGGDFDSAPDAPARVRVRGDAVEIDTREPGRGAVTHTYRRSDLDATLVRVAPAGGQDRVLLDEVASFECAIDEEHGALTVVILRRSPDARPDGRSPTRAARRYRAR